MSLFGYFVVLLFCLHFEPSVQHGIEFPCELNVTEITANVPARIRFRMIDIDYGTYLNASSLANYHNRKMHVVFVSESWSTFQHIHPEEDGDIHQMYEEGYYYVDTTFPNSGAYMMNVDFAFINRYNYPIEGFCKFVINVTGNMPQTPPTKVPRISSSGSIQIRGLPFQAEDKYTNTIFVDDIFSSDYNLDISLVPVGTTFNQLYYCTMIHVSVSGLSGPITNLAPYLNAQVHAVFVHESSSRIWHTHGMNMGNMSHVNCDIDVSWQMLNFTESPSFGPEVMAFLTPELPGLWQAILQLKHNNKLLMAVFQFEVFIEAPPTTSSTTASTTSGSGHSHTTTGAMSSSGGSAPETTTSGTEEENSEGSRAAVQFVLWIFVLIVSLC